MLVQHERLRVLARELLHGGGTPRAEAQIVADHLVDANLRGHDSHGVGMIPLYTWNTRQGSLDPTAHARVTADHGAVLVVDGQSGHGQVVGREAMQWGIERVARHGVCVVALGNAFHLGRIGAYAEQCAAAGYVAMHYVNVVGHSAQVVAFGGAEPAINTNPFACAVPRSQGPPVVLDMATSTVALGKVRVAGNKGEQMPEGCLVDDQGLPTTDPFVMPLKSPQQIGALTPFGMHKGSGLGLMCELLGGALAGGWTINTPTDQGSITNNMLSVLIDPEKITDRDALDRDVNAMIERIHGIRPAVGVERVLVAGEPERISLEARSRDGIEVDPGTWSDLLKMAPKFGVDDGRMKSILNGHET